MFAVRSTTRAPSRMPKGMCIICLDFQKGRLTSKEARRALGEMAVKLDKSHIEEVERAIAKAEAEAASAPPSTKPDP